MNTGVLAATNPERRRTPRYRYQATLEIEWGSALLKARARDFSASGMLIDAEGVLWVSAGFRACLAAECPFWLECSVKRVEPGRGMGVSIALREDRSQLYYRRLLAKLAASR